MGSGRKLPLLTADDFVRVLRAAGYVQVAGTKHLAFEHPTRPGKVNVDEKWQNVKAGSWVFRSVVYDQARLTKQEREALLEDALVGADDVQRDPVLAVSPRP